MKTEQMKKFKTRPKVWIWTLVLAFIFAVIVAGYICLGGEIGGEVLLAAMGGALGLLYYTHTRHAEDARFMKELFEHFNGRYDRLNDILQEILDKPIDHPMREDEKLVIIDYFNLCAEEWVFRQLGYIYDPIWESWQHGMCQYGRIECIAKLWEKEKKTNSYYGFEFPVF